MAGLSAIISLVLARIATLANSRSDQSIGHSVGQPPLIYEGSPAETIIFYVGQRLTLPCRAHGLPSPRYQWYQNGRLLDTKLDTESSSFMIFAPHLGTLHLKTKHKVTEGYYQCLASNEYGVDMSNGTHLQEAVFEDLQPRKVVHNLTVIEGRHLVLRCSHVISVPPPTVYWFTTEMTSQTFRQSHQHRVKTNERITTDDTGGLVITAVTKADARDDLVYKCEAYNYVIRQTNAGGYFRIRVLEEPYNTGSAPELIYSSTKVTEHVGRNVTLTCLFSGRPLANMRWTRRGGSSLPVAAVTTDYGRRLVLTHVTYEDEGYYTCSATNDVGVTQSSISLTVVASPRIVVAPENRNATLGSSASFYCRGQGHPLPTVTWLINARPINSSSIHISWELGRDALVLTDLQFEDTATVACNVSNDYGYALSSAYLIVLPAEPTTTAATSATSDIAATSDSSVVPHASDVVTTPIVTSLYDDDEWNVWRTDDDFNGDLTELYGSDVENQTEYVLSQTTENESPETSQSIEYERESFDPSSVNVEVAPSGELARGDIWSSSSSSPAIDSGLVKCFWFSIPIFLLIVFALVVLQRCRNRKTTYRVEEQEKRNGGNNVDYDSEDSGYDEQRAADRGIKRFEVAEAERNQPCQSQPNFAAKFREAENSESPNRNRRHDKA